MSRRCRTTQDARRLMSSNHKALAEWLIRNWNGVTVTFTPRVTFPTSGNGRRATVADGVWHAEVVVPDDSPDFSLSS